MKKVNIWLNIFMRKLLILLVFLQGCSSVSIHHEPGSMPKVNIETEQCDDLKARFKSQSLVFTCSMSF
jgi:uncharacterized protein YceK